MSLFVSFESINELLSDTLGNKGLVLRVDFLLRLTEEKMVELRLVSFNVLSKAVVELDNLVLVLPTFSVSSSSEIVDGVLVLWLVKSPVSLEAGLSDVSGGVLASILCVLESSLVVWLLGICC